MEPYCIQEYLIEIFVSPWVENHCCRRIKKRGKIMKIIIERKKLNNFLQHGGTFVFQNNNKYKFPYYNGTKNISINPFVSSVLVFCNLKVPIVDYRIICSIHVAFYISRHSVGIVYTYKHSCVTLYFIFF